MRLVDLNQLLGSIGGKDTAEHFIPRDEAERSGTIPCSMEQFSKQIYCTDYCTDYSTPPWAEFSIKAKQFEYAGHMLNNYCLHK